MTPEEAIEILRDTPIDIRSARDDDIHTLYATAQIMAIDALREAQQYRLIKDATIGDIAEVLKEFSEIGTVEECRDAVGKQTAVEPEYEGDTTDSRGRIIYDTWICPTCRKRYEMDYDDYRHCPECGQAIKKGETDEGQGSKGND